jgi:hypothetical protein
MRAADAAEKVSAREPGLLKSFKAELRDLVVKPASRNYAGISYRQIPRLA